MEALRTFFRRIASVPPARTARGRRRACALLLVLGTSAAPWAAAMPVGGLYEGTVPGDPTEAGRPVAAEAALRQVVVRLTGRRAAATDPALAALYASASRYVQTFRPTAGDQVTVGFDAAALESALVRAGQPLWSRDRPATLVALVLERPGESPTLVGGVDADEKRSIERAAQLRGVPLAWPGTLQAASERQRIDDVLAGRADALLAFAAQYDASGVLYGRAGAAGAAGAAGVRWAWSLPVGKGSVTGSPADGVDSVADRYAAELTSGQTGAIMLLPIVVTGTRGPPDYAAVEAALNSIPNVRGVQLQEASGGALTFRVNFRGDLDALRRTVAAGGRLVPQESEPGTVRFALQP